MKHITLVDVPATQRKVVSKITCDLCGEDVKEGLDDYDIDVVTVSRKTGAVYPEGGGGEIAEVDICGDCFATELVPWLKKKGARILTTEWYA